MTSGTQIAPATPSGVAGAARPALDRPAPDQPAPDQPVQRTVVGVDTDLTRTADVDHLIAGLAAVLPRGAVAATHLVRDERPHVSVSLDLPGRLDRAAHADVAAAFGSRPLVVELLADEGVRIGEADVPAGARLAVAETLTGAGGRAVVFPGSDQLYGDLTAADLLARCAVDRVVDVTGADVDPSVVIRTRDFVRPLRVGRRLELTVQPARDATVVPFEDPDPTACCVTHGRGGAVLAAD